MKIKKLHLTHLDWKVEALVFLPDSDQKLSTSVALISHGYTSHKASITNWPIRLCEEGVPCILFDQPGHYLGSFNEVEDFDEYKEHAHELFQVAFLALEESMEEVGLESELKNVIIAGHSLSGLLSIKALDLEIFEEMQTVSVAVGLGMAPQDKLHLFDTPLFKSTLLVREQLVSPSLGYKAVFGWIKDEKEELSPVGKDIYLLCGADDSVVGKDGAERMQELLQAKGNRVILDKPTRLPHHEPQLAAPHLKKLLRDHDLI